MAADKIVLLTSLDPEENRAPLRFKSWNINEKLEKRFKTYLRRMDVELTPVVKHFSTAETLYQTLKDTEVKALIWVGHAGYYEGDGIAQNKSIIDYRGRDLKNVFQAVGPHLRYLGLIGCRGKLFLDEWKENNWFVNAPSLKTYGRKVRTDARKGLRLAMKELKNYYRKNPNFMDFPIVDSPEFNGSRIDIQRSNHGEGKMEAIQLMQRDKFIGLIPSSESDQTLSFRVQLSDNPIDNKIISNTGYSSLGKKAPNLGILEITSELGRWKLFQTRTGKPIGVGKHIYRYTPILRR